MTTIRITVDAEDGEDFRSLSASRNYSGTVKTERIEEAIEAALSVLIEKEDRAHAV